jgi:hypothetical protein
MEESEEKKRGQYEGLLLEPRRDSLFEYLFKYRDV